MPIWSSKELKEICQLHPWLICNQEAIVIMPHVMQISYNIMHNTIQYYINHARHRFYHMIFNFFCNCYCLTEGLRWYYEIPLRTRVISLLLTCCSVLCLSCVPDLAIPRCPMTTEVCRHSCNVSHWRRPSHPHSTFFDYKIFFFEGNMACFCVHVIWVLQWGKVFARHDWASAVGPHAISPWSAKAQLAETGLKHDPRHQDIVLLWWRGGKLFLQKFSPYFLDRMSGQTSLVDFFSTDF